MSAVNTATGLLQAAATIVGVLEPLNPLERRRVLDATETLLGLAEPEPEDDANVQLGPGHYLTQGVALDSVGQDEDEEEEEEDEEEEAAEEPDPHAATRSAAKRRSHLGAHPPAFTDNEVRRMRALHAKKKLDVADVARARDVTPATVYSMLRGSTYSHVEMPE